MGHADFVDTPNGEWWMVSLAKRQQEGVVYLSRETFLSPIKLERREASTAEERGDIVLETSMLGERKELYRAPFKEDEMVLKLESDGESVTFYYGSQSGDLTKIEQKVPLVIISDLTPTYYNGPMVGIYCSSNGEESKNTAAYDWFSLSYLK